MAGKRLVMGPSPGTGLFSHEVKQRDRARYARNPPELEAGGAVGAAKGAALQEEERVNGRLVEILERRCAKLRQLVEEQERLRTAAEEQAAGAAGEIEALQGRVESLEAQLAERGAAERGLLEQRDLAARQGAELQGVRRECLEAQRALREGERELQRGRAEAARSEGEWRAQVAQLLEEARAAQQRIAELEGELRQSREESSDLSQQARELVLRYEDESAQRLELEERCLAMEERLRSREQSVDTAQQKAKQSQLSRQHMDAIAQQRDGKCREAVQRAEQAEQKIRSLEAELSKLKSLHAERGRRLESFEAEQRPPRPAEQQASQSASAEHASSRLPPAPAYARAGSRPGTCGSAASVASSGVHATSAALSLREAKGCKVATLGPVPARGGGEEARLPPGAIRRAGSVPVRRQPNQASEPRSRSVKAPLHPSARAPERQPSAAPASPPSSRPGSGFPDLDIDDRIPDDPGDSSDED